VAGHVTVVVVVDPLICSWVTNVETANEWSVDGQAVISSVCCVMGTQFTLLQDPMPLVTTIAVRLGNDRATPSRLRLSPPEVR
jgi:hypothetical protein